MKYLLFLFFPFLAYSQQTQVVDIIRISAEVRPSLSEKQIHGRVTVTFLILKDTQEVYLDAVAMEPEAASKSANTAIMVRFTKDKVWLEGAFKKGTTYSVNFEYAATPNKALYFVGEQIWTQGQGKNTSHWLPSLDDMNDKIEFDLTILAPKGKTVVSNGSLIKKIDSQGLTSWFFDMKQPMSSYLVAFTIGNYSSTKMFSKSGISLEHYIDVQDTLHLESTYRYSKKLFDFLEAEIGVAYPWQNYKQVPVRDFLYAGMENTGCTFFSKAFVVDSIGFKDRNYVKVNAHELAHQWFGNLVTETSGTHHWLHEGFATYYALLAERELFGDDYYYWKLFESANRLMALSEQGKGQSMLDAKASSLTFYEKGAWALHLLREAIGEASFSAAIKSYLNKYQFKNVNTTQFIAEIKAHTSIDVSQWQKDWLQQADFKATQAYRSLVASAFMKSYFEIASLAPEAFIDKKIFLETALTFPNDYIGQEAVYQLSREPFADVLPLYKIAFNSENLFVRQAIALSQEDSIPKAIQLDFEGLLEDPSYVTQETALLKLWRYFPENRARYLDLTKTSIGFQDRNLRQLWLVLAINTKGYEQDSHASFVKELKGYASATYSFELREIAFDYIDTLSLWDLETIESLLQATTHHYWRFRDAARKHLDTILKQESLKRVVVEAANNATPAEISYLERIGFVIKH
tara:strand:- start:21564 stop:23633 length:2070 start_codon:yes stop_codon:yes gene_type:complete